MSSHLPDRASDPLADSLRRFLERHCPIEGCVQRAQSAAERRTLWQGVAALGLGLLGTQEAGGLAAALPLVRALGAGHCPAPVAEAVVLNLLLPQAAGPAWQQALHEGAVLPALALCRESGGPGTARLQGYTVHGQAEMVDALGATHLAMLASCPERGAVLAWVDLQAPGVRSVEQRALIEGGLQQLVFEAAPADVIVLQGLPPGQGALLWRLLLAARATGALQRAQSLVVEHVKLRRQFGRAIGSFQAVQHKLANVQMALDGALLTQEAAARAYDGAAARWQLDALSAIAAADPGLRHAMLEVHHAFGAIGYAEEHEAPRHFRRVHLDLARAGGNQARKALGARLAQQGQPDFPEADLGEAAEVFRQEVRGWLQAHWPQPQRAAEASRPLAERGWDRAFSRALGEQGWLALTWPREQGGSGRSRLEQLALVQEMARVQAPTLAHVAATALIAPALLKFGSQAQKAGLLPRIARGELAVCLGYSEPEAGSDLAALRTRAVRDGDDWVITGQKCWGTTTDKADCVWLAARTDPEASRHAGISVFLVPLDLPGITIQPAMALYGKTFSTQFYDGVRVPGSALVGEVNQGWEVITGALADERILIGAAVTHVAVALCELGRQLHTQDLLDAAALERLGGLAAEVAIARALLVRSVLLTDQGLPVAAEAAMSKTCTGELMERMAEAAVDLLGPQALLTQGTPGALLDGAIDQLLRAGPMQVIGGGANEIQRTLIAQRGLGLPR